MPFAAHVTAIAAGAQHFGDGGAVAIQIAAITLVTAIHHHVPHPGLVRIEPGQQRSPGGTTARGIVELGEANAVVGQRVDIGGLDLRTVTADVRKAEVIREDDHDVRFFGRDRSGAHDRQIPYAVEAEQCLAHDCAEPEAATCFHSFVACCGRREHQRAAHFQIVFRRNIAQAEALKAKAEAEKTLSIPRASQKRQRTYRRPADRRCRRCTENLSCA